MRLTSLMRVGVDVRSEVMRVAVEEVAAAGILFVAAGGNRKSDQLFYPAAFDHTIGGSD